MEKFATYEERVRFLAQNLPESNDSFTKEYQIELSVAFYKRLKSIINYVPTVKKLRSKLSLYKPTLSLVADIEEDLDLQKDFKQEIEIKYFKGDHLSVLKNSEMAEEINKEFPVEPIIVNGTTKKVVDVQQRKEERAKV